MFAVGSFHILAFAFLLIVFGVLGADAPAPAGSVCEPEAPGVEVVMLAPSDGGVAVHLQSYAAEEVGVRLPGRELRIAPGDYVVVPLG